MTDEPEDIFTLVKAISKTKRDYFRDDATSERSNRVYVPFIVNKALSFHRLGS